MDLRESLLMIKVIICPPSNDLDVIYCLNKISGVKGTIVYLLIH
jgi:hypothetical protein